MDNQPAVESEIGSQKVGIKEQLTTVTPLSKYLAMALFVVLPFVGFYLGRMNAPSVVDVATNQTNEFNETVEIVSTDIQIDKAVAPSATVSSTENALLFSRKDIKVGNIIKIAENQILGSNETDSTLRDYTLTSVKQISIPDKKVEHSIFQACYLDMGTYINTSCEVLVLNTNGQLVSLLDPRSYSSHIFYPSEDVQKLYRGYMDEMIKKDLLNNESDSNELIIRPNDYPYLYQIVMCADGTFKGGCWVDGFDIDAYPRKNNHTKLSGVGHGLVSSPEFSESLDGPTQDYALAGKNVNGKYIEIVLSVWIENLEAKDKTVTVYLSRGDKGALEDDDMFLKVKVPTEERTELEYDYKNQSNEAQITIGSQKFVFDFENNSLKEKI